MENNFEDQVEEISDEQLYYMAAEEVMENMPFENKNFQVNDKDDCVEQLKQLVDKKWLSIDFIYSVAEANALSVHTMIGLNDDWQWQFMAGLSKAKYTRKDFLDHVQKAFESVDKGEGEVYTKRKKKVEDRDSPYGKNYFKERG